MSLPIHSQPDAGLLARSDLLTQRTALAVDKLTALMPIQDTAETNSRDTSTDLGTTGRVPGARTGDASVANGTSATLGSTRETLSFAARTILDLLANANAENEAAPLASATPLATRTEMQSAPLLATKLASLLDQSGMFYEAHLAEWVSGARTFKDIAREPQAMLARPAPAGTSAPAPTPADAPLQQLLALPYSPRDADPAQAALLAAARAELPDAASGDSALAGRAGSPVQSNGHPANGSGAPANRPADVSSFGRHPPVTRTITVGDPIPGPDGARTQSLHAAQSYADVAHAGDPPRAPLLPGHASAPDTAAAPPAPQGPVVHPATEGLVRQQLELLAAQQFHWKGEAWAGTQMFWDISPGQIDEDGSAAQACARSWTTRLVVRMPGMGVVEANLTLSPTTLDVRVNASLDDTASRLSAAIPDLHGRLAASGFVVGQITARADAATQAEGTTAGATA